MSDSLFNNSIMNLGRRARAWSAPQINIRIETGTLVWHLLQHMRTEDPRSSSPTTLAFHSLNASTCWKSTMLIQRKLRSWTTLVSEFTSRVTFDLTMPASWRAEWQYRTHNSSRHDKSHSETSEYVDRHVSMSDYFLPLSLTDRYRRSIVPLRHGKCLSWRWHQCRFCVNTYAHVG
jgi:hypothetical protein